MEIILIKPGKLYTLTRPRLFDECFKENERVYMVKKFMVAVLTPLLALGKPKIRLHTKSYGRNRSMNTYTCMFLVEDQVLELSAGAKDLQSYCQTISYYLVSFTNPLKEWIPV